MLTVVIKNDGEENVIKLTYDNIWREIKDMPDTEIIVADHWFDALADVKNTFVSFVESDCLLSSGYFSSQMGLLKKNTFFRKIAVMSSATAVNQWHNKFYGYSLGENYKEGIIPNKASKSSTPYPVQIAYIPGAIVRVGMLKRLLDGQDAVNGWEKDLEYLSTRISLGFWAQGDGNRVHINPNSSYCTTEDSVNNIGKFDPGIEKIDALLGMFHKESI